MKGVAAYIEIADQEIELIFDDIVSTSASDSERWERASLFTRNIYPASKLRASGLSKEQYAEIGENLILRLLATNSGLK